MSMLVEELERVSRDPMAWAAVAMLAFFALAALWRLAASPRHGDDIAPSADPGEARRLVDRPVVDGPRYFLLMMGGIAMTLTGLTLVARGIYPVLAFYALVAGVFVIQTEPVRRSVRELELRVVAARLKGPEAVSAAVERLRAEHRWLVTLHLVLVGGAMAILLAF